MFLLLVIILLRIVASHAHQMTSTEMISHIGGITVNGVLNAMQVEGTVGAAEYNTFIMNYLIPKLSFHPHPCLIMDNARIHLNPSLHQLLTTLNVRVIWLPPYSPQFNPIELLWRSMKFFVRKVNSQQPNTSMHDLILMALCSVQSRQCRAWFRSAGLSVPHPAPNPPPNP